MGSLVFECGTLEHAKQLAEVMRAADVAEVAAATGETPLEALTRGVKASLVCTTLMFDGQPAAMFGMARPARISALGPSSACGWFLTGESVSRHKLAFIRATRLVQAAFLAQCPILYNWVDERYAGAQWLLRHLGVSLSAPVPRGINGELFRLGIQRRR